MTDLHFQEKGPVWLVQPVTPKGEAWMIDHTSVRALRLSARSRSSAAPHRTFSMARVQTGSTWGSTRPDLSGFGEEERNQLLQLGADLETAWSHPAATMATRKRLADLIACLDATTRPSRAWADWKRRRRLCPARAAQGPGIGRPSCASMCA